MNVLVKFRRPLALTAAVVATAFAFAAQPNFSAASLVCQPVLDRIFNQHLVALSFLQIVLTYNGCNYAYAFWVSFSRKAS